mmetsp:Transcript_12561/g.34351  ORF Transcript_12561/g.34351 Transcript_12561/m.34351 type:complete len:101 (+) Transcript_12561:331-633(+)
MPSQNLYMASSTAGPLSRHLWHSSGCSQHTFQQVLTAYAQLCLRGGLGPDGGAGDGTGGNVGAGSFGQTWRQQSSTHHLYVSRSNVGQCQKTSADICAAA